MRFRRAYALAMFIDGQELICINFLEKKYFSLSLDFVQFVTESGSWRPLDAISGDSIKFAVFRRLVEMSAIVIEGSAEAHLDEQYHAHWEWGPVAGLHHFLIRDADYLSDEEAYLWISKRAKEKPLPPQFDENHGDVVALPYPNMSGETFSTMLRRRSERKFIDRAISQQSLSDLLFVGFGITAMVDDPELGWLPLTMTPSGGARNPFEAYVAVRKVENLDSGMYHYDSSSKNLRLVQHKLCSRSAMLGDQLWVDDASIVVFLVANFQRTMWKYPHPAAYRVVLIEAGHIVQNMMLAAVRHDLVSTPTSAVSDFTMGGVLSKAEIQRSMIYSLSVGFPGPGFSTLY